VAAPDRPVPAVAPGATIGFVGLGRMGLPMARRLVEAGYAVRGHDATDGARARFEELTGVAPAATLVAAAEGARAVLLMLPSSPVVREVVLERGLLHAMRPGSLLVDMGSSEPVETRALGARAAERGVELLDAPVSGGVRGAEAGTLTIMVGGREESVAACAPLFEPLGNRVLRTGSLGAGHAVKALNNLVSSAALLVSIEAFLVAERFGLDPHEVLEAVNSSTGRSYSTEVKIPDYVIPRRYDAGFGLRLMVKDVRTAVALARATGTPTPLSEACLRLWEEAAESLPEDADHTEVARWVEALTRESDAG
jgi:3-hydroxyisobutyrate dehydrogenase